MTVTLAPGSEDNAFAGMLCDLLRQNLLDKPHKARDMKRLSGKIAIVAEDAEVAVTLEFDHEGVRIHDGIVGAPRATIRGTSEVIMAMSNVPVWRNLPIPRTKDEVQAMRALGRAMREGELHTYGLLRNAGPLLYLTRLMSVNG